MLRREALVATGCFLFACQLPVRKAERTFFRMDTITRVVVILRGQSISIEKTWASIDSLLADWEERFSQTARRSELLALNSRKGDSCAVSPMLAEMLNTALRYGDTTGGRFDITILPVKEAWGLGERDSLLRIPAPDTLARLISYVNYRFFSVNSALTVVRFQSPLIRVDAGGVAKGFAIREIDSLLYRLGFADYLIEAGGDIQCRGVRFDGLPWRIGVRHPRSDSLLAVVPLADAAIVTSGDYERFYIDSASGRRIHHIFNPRTGMSCTRNQSVTIRAPEPVEADILSTGLFCMEPDSIIAFVEARPRLECIVVDSAGKRYASKGWANVIEWKAGSRAHWGKRSAE